MKKLFYITTLALIIGSCTNVKKLVEQGRYEDALDYAMKKMAGDDDKETKYVVALEDAYAKLVERDLSHIEYLKSQDRPEFYTKIRNTYILLQDRQNRVKPFLPLVSEEGYAAHFVMNNYNSDIKKASDIAAEHHYSQAQEKIRIAENTGDKLSARAAYNELKTVSDFYSIYKQKDSLMQVANYLGMTRVLVEAANESNSYMPRELEHDLLYIEVTDLGSRWTQYYDDQPEGIPIDYKALILLKDLYVSPERVDVHTHVDNKEIVVGTQTVTKQVTELDTAGVYVTKDIQVEEDILQTITAVTTETILDKTATIAAQIIFIDMLNGNEYEEEKLNGNYVFHSECATYSGDQRALCDSAVHGWSSNCEQFPNDEYMLVVSSEVIKKEARKMIVNSFN